MAYAVQKKSISFQQKNKEMNKKLKKNGRLLSFALMMMSCSWGMTSCSNDDELRSGDDRVINSQTFNINKENLMSEFASVLSKTVYMNKDVRDFLKKEAIHQFDKNYDVLYASVKNNPIGGTTFRDILIANSSVEFIETIEKNVPQLNILFPNISFFNVSAENYDSSDAELPVAISKKKETTLYFNGECTNHLQKGEVPCFHVLVVNENNRVIVNKQTRSGSDVYTFISPNFDNTHATRANSTPSNNVGQKAINAFGYFYKDDNSAYSMSLQRDYIYYRMTPTSSRGTLDNNSREYISYIEVNPNAYFQISDSQDGISSTDPYVKNTSVSRKGRDFSQDELIDILWTKGAYNFRIEVTKSTASEPEVLMVPLKPDEIWNFNMDRSYRHSTMFRHSKYTYRIDPNKFTAKRYYFSPNVLSFGKWDLSTEALTRYVHIEEVDPSTTIETTREYEWSKVTTDKFDGDAKLTLGLGSLNVSGGVSTGTTTTNTTHEKTTVKVTRQSLSDDLGSVSIYFYDPIIKRKTTDNQYELNEYNTGSVVFAITAY